MFAARTPWLALALLASSTIGCAPEPEPLERTHPLVERFPQARLSSEMSDLRMGRPETATFLGDGWSYRERDQARSRHFRWGIGSYSKVALFVVEARDLTLVLEGRPLAGLSEDERTVGIRLNDASVATLRLDDDLAEYRVPLPAAAFVAGDNGLTLEYAPRADGAEGLAGEERGLAVAWYRIAFEGLHAYPLPPLVEPDSDRLFLPYGSQIDYYLMMPAGGVLRADRWGFRGDSDGRLEVHVATDDTAEQRLATLDSAAGLDLPIDVGPDEPIRLSLRAVAGDPTRSQGGVLLASPALWSTPAAAPAAATSATPEPAAPPPRPNIIVYLVDTLRSDRLGCYGYSRPISPRIDEFAETATLFENARGQSTWTLASVASIFTGVWPHSHGITRNRHRLGQSALTMAELLQAQGYATSAVVTNGYVTEAFGLEQGFDDLVLLHTESAVAVNEEMFAWLEKRDRERPFFLYLHTLEPHQPYLPPDEFRERFAPDADEVYEIIRQFRRKSKWEPTESNLRQLLALYDAEVAANDAAFGEALDHLDELGLLDDSLVIFVSDHGEAFHEHGAWGHGGNLFAEALNVPLIVKLPGQTAGRRVEATAQHTDLLPTVLDYLRLEAPPLEGSSLLELMAGNDRSPAGHRPLFAQTSRFGPDTMSVVLDGWKYIERRDPKKGFRRFLYDWRADPAELSSRVEDRPIRATALRAEIDRKLAAGQTYESEASVIDDELRERLRALGYLN